MRCRAFGTTGRQVSRIGLGTMTFGHSTNKSDALRILDRAAAAGVTLIDTANSYPLGGPPESRGQSEAILGEWLDGQRDCFFVATKCGDVEASDPTNPERLPENIVEAVERSLERLRTDYIDLLQVHEYDPRRGVAETVEALDAVVRLGMVRHVGCSNYTVDQVEATLDWAAAKKCMPIVSVQTRYNLLYRAPERDVLPFCRIQGLGLLTYNPLAGGLLTGKYVRTREPRAGDRLLLGKARSWYWSERAFELVATMEKLARDVGWGPTELALAWVLARPTVTAAIIGATRPEQADVIDRVEALEVPEALLEELDRLSAWARESGVPGGSEDAS